MMDRDTWLERILEVMRALGDAPYQERVWVRGEGPEVDSSAEAISALLDDYDLAGLLSASRRKRWLSKDQLSTLQAFETAVSDCLTRDDDRTSDSVRIATPECLALQQLARRTLEAFAPHQVSARLERDL
jgi:hypothetical protein